MKRLRPLAAACSAATLLACFAGSSVQAEPPDQAVAAPPVPPPAGPPPPIPGAGVPDGQWVFTQQYGWIWMTTGDQYTYVPPEGSGEPLEYVYYGGIGWTWIAAPWVWGYGPRPYWGRARPDRFAWYRHGDWRSPQRWHYAQAPEPVGRGRGGIRPAPGRGRPAPAPPRVQGRGGRPAPPERARPSPPARVEGRGEGRRRGEERGEGGEGRGGR